MNPIVSKVIEQIIPILARMIQEQALPALQQLLDRRLSAEAEKRRKLDMELASSLASQADEIRILREEVRKLQEKVHHLEVIERSLAIEQQSAERPNVWVPPGVYIGSEEPRRQQPAEAAELEFEDDEEPRRRERRSLRDRIRRRDLQ